MRSDLLRRLLPGALAVLVCGLGAGASAAQDPDLEEAEPRAPSISFDAEGGRLRLSFGDLLLDGGLRRALEQGLPLRIRVQVELWRDGFFDRQEGEAEWGASIILDPVAREYEVAVAGEGGIGRRVSLSDATELLEEAFDARVRPGRDARYYYLAELEVETLSLSDLDELRRWLGGDVASAVRGEDAPENAIASGVRRIFVRALGLPARRERLRTPAFDWNPRDPGPGGEAIELPDPEGTVPVGRR